MTDIDTLYRERPLLIFTHGRDWFIQQANRQFARIGHGEPGAPQDPDQIRWFWEQDHGYDRTEDISQHIDIG